MQERVGPEREKERFFSGRQEGRNGFDPELRSAACEYDDLTSTTVALARDREAQWTVPQLRDQIFEEDRRTGSTPRLIRSWVPAFLGEISRLGPDDQLAGICTQSSAEQTSDPRPARAPRSASRSSTELTSVPRSALAPEGASKLVPARAHGGTAAGSRSGRPAQRAKKTAAAQPRPLQQAQLARVPAHLTSPLSLSVVLSLSLLSLCLLLTLTPSPARAGGFYLLDRGTRPMGRGGAWVAGADDPGALWYNPAGLGMGGEQLVIDATMTFLSVDYTRVDSGGNTLPTVTGNSAPLPIPTIAGSFDFGLQNLTFGVGVFAPNAALMQWPESVVGPDGQPMAAPQRYSLLSMDGSIIASLAVGAAWTPIPELSIGLGVHVIYGAFAARTGLSACDGTICTFPEDPDYDGVAQLTLNPAFSAIANLGVVYDTGPVRLGASVMTPFELSGRSTIEVRTPSATMFDGAFVRTRDGDCAGVTDEEIAAAIAAGEDHPCTHTSADLDLDFPMVIRFGVQLDLIENLALELAVVWETWSFQRQAAVSPRSVWISDALGGALDYEVGALNIPRNMNDTVSVRLGGEYTIDDLVQVRLGGYFENGSFSDSWLNALTIDSDKIVVSGGASVRVFEGLWIDAMIGYAHLFPRNVTTSEVPQPNPIRPAPAEPVVIGNGSYAMTTPFFGLGLRYDADWVAPGSTPAVEPGGVTDAETTVEVDEATADDGVATEPEPEVAAPVEPEPEASPEPEPEESAEDARARRRRERRRRPP